MKPPPQSYWLNRTRCTCCGSRRVLAVQPGSEPDYAPGGILVERGVPAVAWCRRCWPWPASRRATLANTAPAEGIAA